MSEGLGPLVETAGLLACVDDEYLKRGDWAPLVQAFADAVRAAERERLIRMVEARAQKHNGPHLLTLELNQLAAWMAGKDCNGVPPPRA